MDPPEGPSDDDFCGWMRQATSFYSRLSDEQKNEVLSNLIYMSGELVDLGPKDENLRRMVNNKFNKSYTLTEIRQIINQLKSGVPRKGLQDLIDNLEKLQAFPSQPNQLVTLTEMLPNLLFRDFISHLPSELIMAILKFLDGPDLLSCCQVCRCWRERIECLIDLWIYKARDLGAVVPTVSKITLNKDSLSTSDKAVNSHADEVEMNCMSTLQEHGRMYKSLFLNVLKLTLGLESGTSLTIKTDFIYSGSRRVNSLRVHENNIYIGCDNQVQIRSLTDGSLISSISTHSVCDMIVVHSTIYTASFNANLESWDLHSGVGKHIFCGHTSAVLSVDVSDDESFVLTGSVDKSAKLWDQRGDSVRLVITVGSTVHQDWVFKVKFISRLRESISFITCDATCIQFWTFDLHSYTLDSNGFRAETGNEFISFSFRQRMSNEFYASAWSETLSRSEVLIFDVKEDRLELKDTWKLSGKLKAYILAVGRQFMLVMCSISRRDFLLMDISKKACLARISTPNCLLTRNKSTVALCDVSWLDGFDPQHLVVGLPLFAACVDRHNIMLGSWNAQLMEYT